MTGGTTDARGTTDDAIFGGRLRLRQPRRGYRFAIDSVLLAARAARHAAGRDVLDACAGVGVVGLAVSLLARDAGAPPGSVVAVEIQPDLARLAAHNAAANSLPLDVVIGDLRAPPLKAGAFGLIVANPPYRRAGTGRLAPDAGRALGRHEIALPLANLMRAIVELLAPGGRACIVHLPEREAEVVATAARVGLRLIAIARVRARAGGALTAVMIDFVRAAAAADEVIEEIEVVVHGGDGAFTREVGAVLAG